MSIGACIPASKCITNLHLFRNDDSEVITQEENKLDIEEIKGLKKPHTGMRFEKAKSGDLEEDQGYNHDSSERQCKSIHSFSSLL